MLLSSQDLPSKLTQEILTSRDPGRLLETSVFCHVGLFVGLLMTWQPTSPRMSDPKEKVEEAQDRSCIPSLLLNAIGHAKQIWCRGSTQGNSTRKQRQLGASPEATEISVAEAVPRLYWEGPGEGSAPGAQGELDPWKKST